MTTSLCDGSFDGEPSSLLSPFFSGEFIAVDAFLNFFCTISEAARRAFYGVAIAFGRISLPFAFESGGPHFALMKF